METLTAYSYRKLDLFQSFDGQNLISMNKIHSAGSNLKCSKMYLAYIKILDFFVCVREAVSYILNELKQRKMFYKGSCLQRNQTTIVYTSSSLSRIVN